MNFVSVPQERSGNGERRTPQPKLDTHMLHQAPSAPPVATIESHIGLIEALPSFLGECERCQALSRCYFNQHVNMPDAITLLQGLSATFPTLQYYFPEHNCF